MGHQFKLSCFIFEIIQNNESITPIFRTDWLPVSPERQRVRATRIRTGPCPKDTPCRPTHLMD